MPEIPRTVFAQKAVDFSQLFSISFEKPVVSGKSTYRLEMSTPEGPSTGGGVQGVQHISLVPHTGGPSVVVGSANRTTMNAQLRTFALLKEIHLRRNPGADFQLDSEIYRDVFEKLSKFFEDQGMKLSQEDVAAGSQASDASPASRLTYLLAGAAAVLILGIAVWFLVNRGH